jgi:3D (Asp-Asp-Asp) domain-containing protein
MRKALFLLLLLICSIGASGQVTVTATKYHPGMGGAGWVTASGSRIDNNKLRNYEIKWIALSPDMFSKLGVKMGDEVIIECANERLNGVWIVKDKMAKRLRNRIDILLPKGDRMNFTSPIKVQIRKKS